MPCIHPLKTPVGKIGGMTYILVLILPIKNLDENLESKLIKGKRV